VLWVSCSFIFIYHIKFISNTIDIWATRARAWIPWYQTLISQVSDPLREPRFVRLKCAFFHYSSYCSRLLSTTLQARRGGAHLKQAFFSAEARERGGGVVKIYKPSRPSFLKRRQDLCTFRNPLEEELFKWSLRGLKHKKWQDQLSSDWFLPYCSQGASVRRRKRKVGDRHSVLWGGLLRKD